MDILKKISKIKRRTAETFNDAFNMVRTLKIVIKYTSGASGYGRKQGKSQPCSKLFHKNKFWVL